MQEQASEGEPVSRRGAPPPGRTLRLVTDAREVEAVLLARIHQVGARKQELASTLASLYDIARQLAHSYRVQLETIERLRARVRALEAAAPEPPSDDEALRVPNRSARS
jgi:hypothetical protein